MIGQTLTHYRITATLAVGGMGEVYRATDTKLGREVAIKVLPPEVLEDAERLARFRREAQLLAALNHPHVAAIHGVEEDGEGRPFLILELVPGEDLAQRLKGHALPVDEALEIAEQVAEALEAAHAKGIVHRDLKPANVKLTPEGQVKVLDFGLAKAWSGGDDAGSSSAALSQSPTLAHTGTMAGVILGTAAYMAPEQARGKPVDRRADVWAFGALLYEMLTGVQLFAGDTVTDVFAAVLTREPDWPALPPATPPGVARLMRRCLRRDPRSRLPDIGAARLELQDALSGATEGEAGASEATTAPATPGGPSRLTWALGILAVLATLAAAWGWISRSGAPASEIRRFTVLAPQLEGVRSGDAHSLLFSRDGRHLVTRGREEGNDALFHRRLDSRETRRLEGTSGVLFPFLSPDSEWVAFFRSRDLHKVSLVTGAQVRIATLPQPGIGASWGEDGFILVTTGSSLLRVSADGGALEALLEPRVGQVSRYQRVESLPGGKAALVGALKAGGDRILHLDLQTRELTDLGLRGTDPAYVAGHILYGSEGKVWAVRFDPRARAVQGAPVPIPEAVWIDANVDLNLAVSADGTLAYLPTPATAPDPLVWVSRGGEIQPAVSTRPRFGDIEDVRLSGDGGRVALTDGTGEIWVLDLKTETPTLVNEGSYSFYPVWTDDSQRLAFATDREGLYGIDTKRVGYAEASSSLLRGDNPLRTVSWSATDRALIVRAETPETGMDILVHREGQDELEPLLTGPANELSAVVSPDGRWLAYVSDESGHDEVYVTSYPKPERRVQASNRGGQEPVWSPLGRELFYREGGKRIAVRYAGDGEFAITGRDTLFEEGFSRYRWHAQYDVHPDGSRFLMVQAPSGTGEIAIVNERLIGDAH